MSTWIAIAADDLNDYLVAAQVNALRTAALGVGQTDPFSRVMTDIIERIRFKIQSCSANQLSAAVNTIPPELKWVACYLIIEALQVRIPALRLSEDQKTQVERAVAQLDRIAGCKDKVSQPDDAVQPDVTSSPIEIVNKPTRSTTRETLDGI